MSVKIIAELHPSRRSRTELNVNPKSIAEIIAGLNTGFPLSQARVCLNGGIVTDFSIRAEDGDTLWIKFVPYGSPREAGTGMKIGGWALVALGIAACFIPVVGGILGSALIGTGLSAALGGAVLMNVSVPSLKDREKPESDPSIRGGKNQPRPHGRIPVLFGRHRIYPDLAANPRTEIIGERQYYTQLFCGGYKDCVIDLNSFKLGDTPLADLSQTKDIAKIMSGADPVVRLELLQNGEASTLYPSCVHEEALNAPLQNLVDGGDGDKIPGEIIRTTPDKTGSINVDIFLYNGIGKYDDKGNLKPASVDIRASYKKDGAPDSAYQPLGFFSSGSNVISGAELKTRRFQITKSGLTPGKYTVRIERVTPDSTDSKIIDQVYIGSIRSIKSAPPVSTGRRQDLTLIALRVMATAKLNGVVDSFNYAATSKLPVYSGSGTGPSYWLASEETRNPAAMLLYALRGRPSQQRADPGDIDWPAFEAFYQWCKEHAYFCDAYLSESVTIAELLRMIGATARAEVLRIDSKISVVQDIERPSHVQLFTPKNTKSYSIAMFSADIPDEISLRFINEDSGYAQDELPVYHTPDGKKDENKNPKTVQKVDLWGVTGKPQAWRIGRYNYACLKNRPFIHTVEADIEYLLCNKGDWIQYSGDLALTGAAQGRITGLVWAEDRCAGIRVDEPLEMLPGQNYAARFRLSDGTVLLKDVAVIREPNEIYFTEPCAAADVPKAGDVYAFGIRGQEVIDLIITDIQPQPDLSATLTCVEYSPAIFNVDDPDFLLPEFENKITPVSGAVDSGSVNPNLWKLFLVYHDGGEEPPRPSGDGQNYGWHYARTSQALWQSGKTAESVDAGEWGPPARIKGERGSEDTLPVYLTLTPQTKILETDSGGAILTGLLPFTSQAALYKWNCRIPLVSDVERFPGTGGELFDPMLGDFFPTEQGIVYSLENAPRGVTINRDGLITVSADAALEDEHSITVQAEYEGAVYSAVLFIQVKKRAGEDRYLGTAGTIPQTAEVTILKGPVQGRVRALQGCYVLAVVGGTVGSRVWKAGYVYQWTGLAWEERDPAGHTDLYIRCFKDGLTVEGLKKDMEWFGAAIAELFIAQRAFIETLESQILKISGVIYGGDRFDADGNIVNPNKSGWYLGPDGILKAFQGVFNNIVLTANSFEISANNKGYLPVGFIYFQLKGQPEPKELFSGIWENISSQFAGLFFRVEGGNAAAFGAANQDMEIQAHNHNMGYLNIGDAPIYGGDNYSGSAAVLRAGQVNTQNKGGIETRPVNTTIRIWKRVS